MSSKIEQIIEEMEDYIYECKAQKFSSTNIIVEKEKLEEFLRELKVKTPDEIKRYQKIISNKEAILNDAREKADALIAEAQAHTNHMVNEHEVMKRAYDQANMIVQQAVDQAQGIYDKAISDANTIRQSAVTYTDEMLNELQNIIKTAVGIAESRYGSFIAELKECSEVIEKNRSVLYPQVNFANDVANIEGNGMPEGMNVNPENNAGETNNSSGNNSGAISLDIINK